MSAPIDERLAWNLVRSVPRGLGEDVSVRVHHHRHPEVWLQVHGSGHWEASAPLTDEARVAIDLFLPLQLRADLVIGQIGQSLDGRIATESGHSHYVTGPADIRRLHRLRALVDAVVVGVGTVLSDNPRLTVRDVEGENPVRVVLDPNGRLRDSSLHVLADRAARTLVVHCATAEDGAAPDPDVLVVPARDHGRLEPASILDALRGRGLRRVLVEGGGITISRFLQAGALDRLHVTVAPMLIGSGHSALTLDPIGSLTQAIRPRCRTFRLGADIVFDLDLRNLDAEREMPMAGEDSSC